MIENTSENDDSRFFGDDDGGTKKDPLGIDSQQVLTPEEFRRRKIISEAEQRYQQPAKSIEQGLAEQYLSADVIAFLQASPLENEVEDVALLVKELQGSSPDLNVDIELNDSELLISANKTEGRDSVRLTHRWELENGKLVYSFDTVPLKRKA